MRSPSEPRKSIIGPVALLAGLVLAIVVVIQALTLTTPSVPATPPNGCAPAIYPPAGGGAAAAECGPREVARFQAALTSSRNSQHNALAYGGAAAAALFVIGACAVAFTARSRRRRREQDPRGARPRPSSAAERERRILVDACIRVSDRLSNPALREELLDALESVGVTPVEVPPGQRFDASHHHAADRVMTPDAAQDNVVFKTERAGFMDRGERVRYPEVLVYKTQRG